MTLLRASVPPPFQLSQPAQPCPGGGDSEVGCQAVIQGFPGEKCLGWEQATSLAGRPGGFPVSL